MRNKSDLRVKKDCKITWRKRRKWHQSDRARHFNAKGKHYERLLDRAYHLIFNKEDSDDEEEY